MAKALDRDEAEQAFERFKEALSKIAGLPKRAKQRVADQRQTPKKPK